MTAGRNKYKTVKRIRSHFVSSVWTGVGNLSAELDVSLPSLISLVVSELLDCMTFAPEF